jgi:four helix bundle protein
MSEQADRLRVRISEFAVAVLRLVRRLPTEVATDPVVRQVARSAAGVASNYRAACCARSRAEFIAKLGTAVEEADETEHWLWMAGQLGLASGSRFDALVQESRELRAILAASVGTARRNAKADKQPDE